VCAVGSLRSELANCFGCGGEIRWESGRGKSNEMEEGSRKKIDPVLEFYASAFKAPAVFSLYSALSSQV
jgi:hypothetical protein